MKRSKPLKRSKGFTVTLDQVVAWRRRSQPPASAGQAPTRRWPTRAGRNDSVWRAECLETRGAQCRVPSCLRMVDVQVDHLIPRAHGGPSVVENGLVLCRHHHEMKTNHELLVDPTWLEPDQVRWLSDNGYADWLVDGIVVGTRRRIFADGHPDRSML